MTAISDEDAKTHFGISTAHETMPNGEVRFRLTDRSGHGYILTKASTQGAWQRSHVHQAITETYIVQSGWIAVAEFAEDGRLALALKREGDVWTAPSGRAHNIFMGPDAITHVVKHGQGPADWRTDAACSDLDSQTTRLTAQDIQRLVGTSPGGPVHR